MNNGKQKRPSGKAHSEAVRAGWAKRKERLAAEARAKVKGATLDEKATLIAFVEVMDALKPLSILERERVYGAVGVLLAQA